MIPKKYWRYKVKYIFVYVQLFINFFLLDYCNNLHLSVDFFIVLLQIPVPKNVIDLTFFMFGHLSILHILCLDQSQWNVTAAPCCKWCSSVITDVTDTLCGFFLRYKPVTCWRSKGFHFVMDVPYFYKICYCVSLIVFN